MAIGSVGLGCCRERFSPHGQFFATGDGARRSARRQIAEHGDRLIEQGAVLLVERGMDEFGLDFGRHIGSRARTILGLRHHLIDRLDLCQRCRHQPVEGHAHHRGRAFCPGRRIDADDEHALLDLEIAEHGPAVFHRPFQANIFSASSYSAEETRILVIQLLSYLLGDQTDILPGLIAQSQKEAYENLKARLLKDLEGEDEQKE